MKFKSRGNMKFVPFGVWIYGLKVCAVEHLGSGG